ncbi:MAG: DnaJ domain-containing protein [Blastocatellia bacterium]
MAFKDYYAILMVHPQAEAFVIEAAYKRLAREYHPDLRTNVGNPRHQHSQHEKMLEINGAYEVLSNPNRRKSFDQDYVPESPPANRKHSNKPARHTHTRCALGQRY